MASGTSGRSGSGPGLVFSRWNLLLLVPFVILVTPLYNRAEPALFGLPFFYWFQFAVIVVGVLCTATVYRLTRRAPSTRPERAASDVDQLDEGTAG